MKNISLSVSNTYCIARGKVMSIFAIYLHSTFHFSQEAGFFSSPFCTHNENPSPPHYPEYLLCRQGHSAQTTLQNSLQEWDTEHCGTFL